MNINVMRGLIELLRQNGGSIDNRIVVHKQAYILQQFGYPRFAPPRYAYHHFGPYSRDLADTLHAAVLDGWIREVREEFTGEYVRYSYHLTDDTAAFHTEPMAEPWARVVDRMRSAHWRTLVLAASAVCLERRYKLPPDQALVRALVVNESAFHPYESAARNLLDDLRAAAPIVVST